MTDPYRTIVRNDNVRHWITMVDPYRTMIVRNDNVHRNEFVYYLSKARTCPICNSHWKDMFDNFMGTKCYPEKRVVIRGFWFWRRYCPLPGVHEHFRCRICNAENVYMINDDPLKPIVVPID